MSEYFDGVHEYPVADPAKKKDRIQVAKIAAHARWSKTSDRSAATQPARDGLMRKFEDQVDPERKLAPEVRAVMAESAKRAHFQRLALMSAQARRATAAGGAA